MCAVTVVAGRGSSTAGPGGFVVAVDGGVDVDAVVIIVGVLRMLFGGSRFCRRRCASSAVLFRRAWRVGGRVRGGPVTAAADEDEAEEEGRERVSAGLPEEV